MKPRAAIFRKESFNAAHRLYNPNWSNEKNDEVFGKCNNKNYHGHNYDLVVKLIGEIDEQTGYVMDTKILSELINKEIIEKFDHKNLNLDVPEFTNLNPSAENIAMVVYQILRDKIDKKFEIKVILYETPRNFVEYPA